VGVDARGGGVGGVDARGGAGGRDGAAGSGKLPDDCAHTDALHDENATKVSQILPPPANRLLLKTYVGSNPKPLRRVGRLLTDP